MGIIQHHAIVVTGFKASLQIAHDKATSLGLCVSPISPPQVNAFCSLCVFPDGSKEGWGESEEGDRKRGVFREWLTQQHALDWVEVSFGELGAQIVQEPPSEQGSSEPENSPATVEGNHPCWEYWTDKIYENEPTVLDDALDDVGRQGWELVAVYNSIYIFKRPRAKEVK